MQERYGVLASHRRADGMTVYWLMTEEGPCFRNRLWRWLEESEVDALEAEGAYLEEITSTGPDTLCPTRNTEWRSVRSYSDLPVRERAFCSRPPEPSTSAQDVAQPTRSRHPSDR